MATAFYLTCEQPGALRIRGDFGSLRETIKVARGVRHMPPPPWAGAFVRLSLYREGGALLRSWVWLASTGWLRE